jgi:hypothetical protein
VRCSALHDGDPGSGRAEAAGSSGGRRLGAGGGCRGEEGEEPTAGGPMTAVGERKPLAAVRTGNLNLS